MFTGQDYHSINGTSAKKNENNKRGRDETSKILDNKIPHKNAAATTSGSVTARPLDPSDMNYSTNMAGMVDPMHYTAADISGGAAVRNSLPPQYANMAAGNASLHDQAINASASPNYHQATYLRQQQQQQQQQQPMKTEDESQLYGDILMNSGVVHDVHQDLATHTNIDQLSSGRKSVPNDAATLPANSSTAAAATAAAAVNTANTSALNKQLYLMNMNMNNNPHALNDPSILETLSPFFQPFGVDVAHLPMTNPPIFQSSLPGCDEPVRRRRISISNGQISQLGEDIETLENLHNTQPPPMPNFHNYHNGANKNKYVPHRQTFNQTAPVDIPLYGAKKNTNPLSGTSLADQNSDYTKDQRQHFAGSLSKNISTESTGDLEGMTTFAPTTDSSNSGNKNMNKSTLRESHSNPSFSSKSQASNINLANNSQEEPTPGTSAWKRARLLERNRIAASKCRQRKKVAQLQLQREFDDIKDENKILQKKLNYYEKLISKFKKFSKIHLREHEKLTKNSEDNGSTKSNSNSESTTVDSLKIIEELLMIDSDVTEVDKETGKIIAIKHEPYSQRFDSYVDEDDMDFVGDKLTRSRNNSEDRSLVDSDKDVKMPNLKEHDVV
ncbi:hypothetical protein N7582_003007 [Saccharomyces uvarum]|uniref:BZIP domain-containing protein n=1 Tax=Saccharomyces uvarum TaxID=230603 RepID=A0AA35NV37_SACUV|nr:hypothetical protein N7582_003007 [Saccharomyces uvarum]CAI4065396.1 hypothetical protein SUVC_09G1310 [Saccharomyces uvarum]